MRTDVAVGQEIYVPTSLYISHGEDDFHGGLCRVISVEEAISAGVPTLFVEVAERPGSGYNWDVLAEKQQELKAEFGNCRGYKDPDYVSVPDGW